MYRIPSARQRKTKAFTKLNLIPILDSIFIFIFFLLVSSNFINFKEIGSDVPIIAESPPSQEKEPLALTVIIEKTKILVTKGLSPQTLETYNFDQLEELQSLMIRLKEENSSEKTIILEPNSHVSYDMIVKVMDAIRGAEEEKKNFENIVFSNIMDE